MNRCILASNNAAKMQEMRELLSGLELEVISQREAGCDFVVDETGTTFEENALLKASAVTRATGEIAIADDSGLCVEALGGAPGVYSARYGGSACTTDDERNACLLAAMQGQSERRAAFVSCIACTFPNGDVITARGECPGTLLTAPCGSEGFGYDPIFEASATPGKSMAELTPDEKNAISHRGAALRAFLEKLRWYYADK